MTIPQHRHRTIAAVVLALVAAGCVAAAEPSAADRPKIGLALSGGGAKGGAHVGVLRVIEELQIPVDYIAGTSMGAVVGGLYASGMTAERLEEALLGVDWTDALEDSPDRKDLPFRRKEDSARYRVKLQLGFKGGKIVWPSGYMAGQKLYFILQTLTLPVSHVNDFDDLPIPFRCVASDISTGDPVVLGDGNLATAIRASMAIPSVFAPVEWKGMTLVDGGVTNNLPIDVVREMGADIVIAVDLGAPLTSRDVKSLLQIQNQLTRMLIRKNVEPQLERADLVIRPDVATRGTLKFGAIGENMQLGEEAADLRADELRRWSIDEQSYRRLREKQTLEPGGPPTIAAVRLKGNRRVDSRIVRNKMRLEPGDTFDFEELFEDISRIYGLGDFQQVSFAVEGTGEQIELIIDMVEKPWGPNYMNFGASLETDLRGNIRAGALVNLTLTRINKRGAESRNDLQIGTRRFVRSEFFQPLDFKGHFFVAPRLEFDAFRGYVFLDGREAAEQDTRIGSAGIDVGYQVPRYGELRLGYLGGQGAQLVESGFLPPELNADDFDVGGIRARVVMDRLDNFNVPRRGWILRYDNFLSRKSLGADEDFHQSRLGGGYWHTRGKNTFMVNLEGGWVHSGTLPPWAFFRVGGFFSLSGFALGELRGQYFGVGRLGYYRHVTKKGFFGGWVELGGVWLTRDDVRSDDLILTGTLFYGMDTLVGPVYAAYGLGEGGHDRFYLILGRTF